MTEPVGTPIEEGMFLSGNTNVDGSSGSADLTIPISGPKGKAKVYAVATKRAGRWAYSTLEAEIDGRDERIDLLGAEAVERCPTRRSFRATSRNPVAHRSALPRDSSTALRFGRNDRRDA